MQTKTLNELDSLFRICLLKRDRYSCCPLCFHAFSDMRRREVNHYMKRRYTKTRWEPENAIIACSVCNGQDKSIEPELIRRGVDVESIRRQALSFGKVDTDAVRVHLENMYIEPLTDLFIR